MDCKLLSLRLLKLGYMQTLLMANISATFHLNLSKVWLVLVDKDFKPCIQPVMTDD